MGLLCWSFLMPLSGVGGDVVIQSVRLQPGGGLEVDWTGDEAGVYQVEVTDSLSDAFAPGSDWLHLNEGRGTFVVKGVAEGIGKFVRVHQVDPLATAYAGAASVLDSTLRRRVEGWYSGLADLGLLDPIVFMASLASDFQPAASPTLVPMAGPVGIYGGGTQLTPQGALFVPGRRVRFANPLPRPVAQAFSIFVCFSSSNNAREFLVGSGFPTLGPSVYAGGSPMQGAYSTDLFFDYTEDGSSPPRGYGETGRRTFGNGNLGRPQTAMFTFSTNWISCQADIDRTYRMPLNSPGAWNDNDNWSLGARVDEALPFQGTMQFAAVFNRGLDEEESLALRSLFARTIGAKAGLPRVNVIFEGDSLTDESSSETVYSIQLLYQPNWRGRFNKRNIAMRGEQTWQMRRDFAMHALPFAGSNEKNYLFLWSGANDLGKTPVAALSYALTSYWQQAREAGFIVVAFTVLPSMNHTAADGVDRAEINAWIRGQAGIAYDQLIDVASIPSLQDPTDGTVFLPDGIHLRTAGHRIVAEAINAAIPEP